MMRLTDRWHAALPFVLASLLALLLVQSTHARALSGVADPAAYGAFDVGHTTEELVDTARANRTLPSHIWYPAKAGSALGTRSFYSLRGPIGLTSAVAVDDITPTRLANRPLIVFSHGSGGIAIQSIVLCETLASHGFVVIAVNHTGNTQFDITGGTSDSFAVIARNRPRDVSFAIDAMLARSDDPGDMLYQRISPTQIGVIGHSFGGFTALAVASGYADVPADARVRAIVSVAGAASILSAAELHSIHIPTLHIGGTKDTVVPLDPVTERAFALIEVAGRRHYRVDVVGAGHNHFANVCDIGQALINIGLTKELWPLVGAGGLVGPYNDACVPPALPIAQAQRLQNLYAVAFFQRHLAQNAAYGQFLSQYYAKTFENTAVKFSQQAPRIDSPPALPGVWKGRRTR